MNRPIRQQPCLALADGVQDVIALYAAAAGRVAASPSPSAAEIRLIDAKIRAALENRPPLSERADQPVPRLAVEDIRVPGPHGTVAARRYLPPRRQHGTTLVFWHGGGWVCGSWRSVDRLCARFAESVGIAVLNVDYALAPESPFPHGLHDAIATTAWAIENSPRWGGDGTVVVGGESAGANLAAAVSLARRDSGDAPVLAQLLLYPALSPRLDTVSARDNADGYELTTNAVRYFWGQYLGDASDLDMLAAPLHADSHRDLPPAVVAAAEFDPLRDDATRYAELLAGAGVPVSLRVFAGLIHGFARWPEWAPLAADAVDQIAAMLAATLTATESTP